ncbi:MAG: hypothetical protein MUP30_06505 [Deltaproteobacteria bacterium]|nr:hypothetical protein [Deltaproteobacteria bacterium]
MDESFLDKKYFIDSYKYNCPFCNRGHVSYTLNYSHSFNWEDDKKCYVYFVKCDSCSKTSMHLSFTLTKLEGSYSNERFPKYIKELDNEFFYSVPTSFFVLDERIPEKLRELITEAEGCLKSNFLTGASACARKAIYELAKLEGATGNDYDERIKSLKKIKTDIDSTYFDTLLTIQQVTSNKVHENSYDGWESKHLRLILSTLMEILTEIYVIPKLRKEKRKGILDLKAEVLGTKPEGDTPQDK